MSRENLDPNCLLDFNMPWLLTRELYVNGSQKLMINAFKLATASQAFWNLLQSVGRDGQLNFDCDQPKDLEIILRYAHIGEVDVTLQNVERLIDISKRFDVNSLLQACEQFLITTIKIDNCWDAWKLAKQLNLSVMTKIHLYMLENFSAISKYTDFLKLNYEELKTFLDDDRVNVQNEIQLFEAVIKWIENDLINREKYLVSLLNCLRLARLSLNEINAMEKNNLVKMLPQSLKMTLVLAKRQILRSKRGMRVLPEAHHLSRPRLPHQCILVFGGGMFCSPYRKIKVYNNRDDTWSILPRCSNIPTGRVFFETVVLDDYLYMLGGLCEKFIPTPSVFKFSLLNLQWSPSAPMQECRFFFASVVLNQKIYAIGGHREGWETLSSVERYTIKTNRWVHVAPLLLKRNRSTAATLNDRIYVCGGNSGDYGAVLSQWLCTSEVYDPLTNQWTYIKPIPENIWGCYKIIAVTDRLYLIQSCKVSMYDPLTKNWKSFIIENMPEHFSFTVTELDGEIYRFSDSSVDKWKPDDLVWHPVKESIFTPGWGHQSVSVKGVNIVHNILSKSTQVLN